MARIYSHSESRAKGSVGMTTYRTIRGRVIQSQKVAPWDPSIDHVGNATRWNERTALLGIISLWCSFHAQSLKNSFNKTRFGSPRNYFFKKNFAALKEAFAILAAQYAASKQAPEMAQIEQALGDYALAHPSTIYRVKKSGYDVVFLAGAWDDSDDPADPVLVSSIVGNMNEDFRLVSATIIGSNINPSVKFYLGGLLVDGTLSIGSGANSGVFMPRQQVYVQGEQILDCRVGSRVLASTTLEGDDRTFHTLTLGVTPQGGGACTGAGSYPEGTAVTIQAIPASGYQFVKWSDDNTNATRSITLNADMNLTAQFASIVKKIRFDFGEIPPEHILVDEEEITILGESEDKYAEITTESMVAHKVEVQPWSGDNFSEAKKNGSALVELSTDQSSWSGLVETQPFYVRLKADASGTSIVDVAISGGF